MTGAETSAIVAVEILVKQDAISPVWVILELLHPAVHGPSPGGIP
jgi:hypothetical protein